MDRQWWHHRFKSGVYPSPTFETGDIPVPIVLLPLWIDRTANMHYVITPTTASNILTSYFT